MTGLDLATYVLVDLENAFGQPWSHLTTPEVREHTAGVLARLPKAPTVVAANSRLLGIVMQQLDSHGATLRAVPPRPDAADLLLRSYLDHLPVQCRHVVLVSGDAIFADVVAATAAHVTVHAPIGCISARLAAAADAVLLTPIAVSLAA